MTEYDALVTPLSTEDQALADAYTALHAQAQHIITRALAEEANEDAQSFDVYTALHDEAKALAEVAKALIVAAGEEPEGWVSATTDRDKIIQALRSVAPVYRINALRSACGHLPVGTAVRFQTSKGWYDSETSEGIVTKVTDASYVVTKTGLWETGSSRLDRWTAHESRSSYGNGGRSLWVLRTPAEDAVFRAEQEAANAAAKAARIAEEAGWRAARKRDDARNAQAQIQYDARSAAIEALIEAHRAEFDALVIDALDRLSEDAPGRDETA